MRDEAEDAGDDSDDRALDDDLREDVLGLRADGAADADLADVLGVVACGEGGLCRCGFSRRVGCVAHPSTCRQPPQRGSPRCQNPEAVRAGQRMSSTQLTN